MGEMSDLIEARWVPAYSVTLADGREVNHGDVVRISAGEARESDNWAPVKAARPARVDESKSEDS